MKETDHYLMVGATATNAKEPVRWRACLVRFSGCSMDHCLPRLAWRTEGDLQSNIAAEARAKIVYERLINITDDPGVKDELAFRRRAGMFGGCPSDEPVAGDEAASIALEIIDIIKSHLIVDIWSNEVAQNHVRNAIDDYFFDVLSDEKASTCP